MVNLGHATILQLFSQEKDMTLVLRKYLSLSYLVISTISHMNILLEDQCMI